VTAVVAVTTVVAVTAMVAVTTVVAVTAMVAVALVLRTGYHGNTSDWVPVDNDDVSIIGTVRRLVLRDRNISATNEALISCLVSSGVVKVNAIASVIKTPNLRRCNSPWNFLRRHCDCSND
jgi:hypothetical protein